MKQALTPPSVDRFGILKINAKNNPNTIYWFDGLNPSGPKLVKLYRGNDVNVTDTTKLSIHQNVASINTDWSHVLTATQTKGAVYQCNFRLVESMVSIGGWSPKFTSEEEMVLKLSHPTWYHLRDSLHFDDLIPFNQTVCFFTKTNPWFLTDSDVANLQAGKTDFREAWLSGVVVPQSEAEVFAKAKTAWHQYWESAKVASSGINSTFANKLEEVTRII